MPEETEPSAPEEYMDFEKLKSKVRHFVRERDWEKFHTPKDLAISISVEAAELLEIFQFMTEEQMKNVRDNKVIMESIHGELADILQYCFGMANALGISLSEAVDRKMELNEKRYPKDKFRGIWKKE